MMTRKGGVSVGDAERSADQGTLLKDAGHLSKICMESANYPKTSLSKPSNLLNKQTNKYLGVTKPAEDLHVKCILQAFHHK